MLEAGRFALLLAFGVALYGIVASLLGARTGRQELVDSGRRAVYALAVCVAVAFAILETAFLRSDFSFELVAAHSSTTTPGFYRATAIWSSQEGSLLLWLLLLTLWSSLVMKLAWRRARHVAPYATAVLLGFGAFFAAMLVLLESPFTPLEPAMAEGRGLNPLLRHPSMMIHPPMLYAGYTLFAVPFAFAVGALVSRRLDATWIRLTRPYTLAAWFFLGIGIILGARWSYSELGWGGYWAWDPVENASLMPWLTGTAFLHSVMIQEKRGMLKVWNVSLVLATGVLAILGTFLVRSGILESIHAFGASTLGLPFLILIVTMIAGSVALVVWRAPALRSEHRLDSLLSREAAFLLNNLVLVGMCFVVFWGTFFPLISEAITGTEASVGPPWFDRYLVPLALMLVLLSGIGPVIAWRRATAANLKRNLLKPALAGLAVMAAAALLAGAASRPLALAMFGLGAFALAVVAQELWRGVRARRIMAGESVPAAVMSLFRRNRRRYGGYTVHAGVALLFIGIAASSAFQDVQDVSLAPGETARAGPYELTYAKATGGLVAASNGRLERIDLGAQVAVRRDGRDEGAIVTYKSYFPTMDPTLGVISRFFEGESTSEVGLRAGWRRDLWVAVAPDVGRLRERIEEGDRVFGAADLPRAERDVFLAQALRGLATSYRDGGPAATFRIIVSPMVSWIWLGAIVVFAGGLIALWPFGGRSRPVTAAYVARVAREEREVDADDEAGRDATPARV
jgi:cytochrome c-type biogenesis protein CcmF